jgi:hypothetical protein
MKKTEPHVWVIEVQTKSGNWIPEQSYITRYSARYFRSYYFGITDHGVRIRKYRRVP